MTDLIDAIAEFCQATRGVIGVNAEHDAQLTAARDKLMKAACQASCERRQSAPRDGWAPPRPIDQLS
jgi:hypothetical protein